MTRLELHRLQVRRMPGIDPGFELCDLCPGVNVIHGPNGSGKSSTARAIEAVMWPEAGARQRAITVIGECNTDDASYQVRLDAGAVTVQRDGVDISPPVRHAPELRHRYRLSLRDLLHDPGRDFASEILQQSFGGVDVQRAAEGLGFRASPSVPQLLMRAFNTAKDALRDAQTNQHTLLARAETLADLEHQKHEARRALARRSALECAIRYARARQAATRAKETLDLYPAVLANLHGNERQQLQKVCARLETAKEHAESAESKRTQALYDAERALHGGALPETFRPQLHEHVVTLQELTRDLLDAERTLAGCAASEHEARRVIGPAIQETQLAAIDTIGFNDLAKCAAECERAQAALTIVDAELRHLEDVAESHPPHLPDTNTLQDGIRLLSRWLRIANGASTRERWLLRLLWTTTGIATVLAVILAVQQQSAHLQVVFALIAGLSLAIAIFGPRMRGSTHVARLYEHEYSQLALVQPGTWSVDAVCQVLDALQQTHAAQVAGAEQDKRRANAERARQPLVDQVARLQHRAREVAGRFGVAPDTDVQSISWLADRIGRWQDAARVHAEAQARLSRIRAQCAERLARIGDLVASRPEWRRPQSANEATALLETIEQRSQEYSTAVRNQQQADAEFRIATEHIEQATNEYDALFATAQLQPGDVRAFEELCGQHGQYRDAVQAYKSAQQSCATAQRDLETNPVYEPNLLGADLQELDGLLADTKDQEAILERLSSTIAEIRLEISRAERGTTVENALSSVANAKADLRDAYVANLRAVIGHRISQYIHETTRDQHLPEVFHRARKLFAEITSGRYRLDFDSTSDSPAFRVFDTVRREGQTLETLSSGTQVQLQLAVRVAFVESQEDDIQLPLLLDETLGTSDDERAGAMIDAVIALAKRGRQIFYFTAQADEAGKWLAALDRASVSRRVIDLAEVRRIARSDSCGPLPITAISRRHLPDPAGLTHREFGALLQLPAIRLGDDSIGATPLWYVIDDLPALHRLYTHHVDTWGALQNMLDVGGTSSVALSQRTMARANTLIRALETIHRYSRIGRGKRVDRSVLEASDAVSPVFIDVLSQRADDVDGQADRLLENLTHHKPRRFQKLRDLETYLVENDYLDTRDPWPLAQIRLTVVSEAQEAIASGTITEADIDLLLNAGLNDRSGDLSPLVGTRSSDL